MVLVLVCDFYVILLARLVLQISYLSQLRHRIVPGRTLGLGAPVLAEDREPVDVFFFHISKGFVYLLFNFSGQKNAVSPRVHKFSPPPKSMNSKLHSSEQYLISHLNPGPPQANCLRLAENYIAILKKRLN